MCDIDCWRSRHVEWTGFNCAKVKVIPFSVEHLFDRVYIANSILIGWRFLFSWYVNHIWIIFDCCCRTGSFSWQKQKNLFTSLNLIQSHIQPSCFLHDLPFLVCRFFTISFTVKKLIKMKKKMSIMFLFHSLDFLDLQHFFWNLLAAILANYKQ